MVKADPKRNYYADLEVTPDADADDIRKQFRKLALKWHPDRNPGKEQECVPRFQAIQAAHEILGDPGERTRYD
ncbi:DnaJ domain-containing protein, partial [Phyllosticta paracitricarpa]